MMDRAAALSLVAMAVASQALAADDGDCVAMSDVRLAQACFMRIDPFAQLAVLPDGQRLVARNVGEITGDFAELVSGDPKNLRSPLVLKALANEGKRLKVRVGPVDPQRLEYNMNLEAFADGSASGQGALLGSTYGPDVSGRDILTWYHRQRLGAGYVGTISVTHGFSDLRRESRDGAYEAVFLDLEKAYRFGLVNLSYSYSNNEAGGDTLIYQLGGKTNRYSGSLTNWATPTWRFMQKIEYTEREQDMRVFDLKTEHRYSSGVLEVAYEPTGLLLQAKMKKGLSGHQDFNLIPLMGSFNPNYWSFDMEGRGEISLSDRLKFQARIEAMKGARDMPTTERLGLGGPGAGSSHESGLFNGYKGIQHDLSLRYDLVRGEGYRVIGKTGINGADIRTATDDELGLGSAEIGLEFHSKKWSITTSYSKSIRSKNIDDDQRLNAQVIWRY